MLAVSKSQSEVKRGENIILGGLGIQILFFGFFIVVTLVFHLRIRKRPTPRSKSLAVPWARLIWVLYGTSFLILVRSLYRVAEYVLGSDGVLQSVEYWLYIFDALPMFIVSALFNWFHPSKVVNRNVQLASTPSLEVLEGGGYAMDDGHSHGRHDLSNMDDRPPNKWNGRD